MFAEHMSRGDSFAFALLLVISLFLSFAFPALVCTGEGESRFCWRDERRMREERKEAHPDTLSVRLRFLSLSHLLLRPSIAGYLVWIVRIQICEEQKGGGGARSECPLFLFLLSSSIDHGLYRVTVEHIH